MHLPSIYVQKVVKGPSYEKRIERVTLAQVIKAQRLRESLLWKHYILENEIEQVESLVKVLDTF